MENKKRNSSKKFSNKKIINKIKNAKRRKTSLPLQLKSIIKNGGIHPIKLNKDSFKKKYSSSKKILNLNGIKSIEKETKIENKSKNDISKSSSKKINKNNNYYIRYIKNIYQNEDHLLNKNLFNKKKSVSNNNLLFLNLIKNKHNETTKRRHSGVTQGKLEELNFGHKNVNFNDKTSFNSKNQQISILLHKKKLNKDEKKQLKQLFKNNNKEKNEIKKIKKNSNNDVGNKLDKKEEEKKNTEKVVKSENKNKKSKNSLYKKFPLCCCLMKTDD